MNFWGIALLSLSFTSTVLGNLNKREALESAECSILRSFINFADQFDCCNDQNVIKCEGSHITEL